MIAPDVDRPAPGSWEEFARVLRELGWGWILDRAREPPPPAPGPTLK